MNYAIGYLQDVKALYGMCFHICFVLFFKGSYLFIVVKLHFSGAQFQPSYLYNNNKHIILTVCFCILSRDFPIFPRHRGHVTRSRQASLGFLSFGSNVGGVCAWKKWTLEMHEFDHSEIRSVESVNGAKTGP